MPIPEKVCEFDREFKIIFSSKNQIIFLFGVFGRVINWSSVFLKKNFDEIELFFLRHFAELVCIYAFWKKLKSKNLDSSLFGLIKQYSGSTLSTRQIWKYFTYLPKLLWIIRRWYEKLVSSILLLVYLTVNPFIRTKRMSGWSVDVKKNERSRYVSIWKSCQNNLSRKRVYVFPPSSALGTRVWKGEIENMKCLSGKRWNKRAMKSTPLVLAFLRIREFILGLSI